MNVNMCRNESVQTSRPYLHARKQRNGTWSKRHTAGSECECAGVGRTARCACVVVREKKDFINKRDVRSKELEKGSDSPEVAHAPHRTFCADFFNGRVVPAQLGAEQRA